MKKKIIILAAVSTLIIAGAGLLYNKLSAKLLNSNSSNNIASGNRESANIINDTDDKDDTSEEETISLAPNFTVYDQDGNAVELHDMFGKTLVVNFWASWCGPCKQEMPYFQDVYEEMGEDVVFLMVNLTSPFQEPQKTAEEFIENQGYTFPVYYDTDQDAASNYGIISIPQTYIINDAGEIVNTHIGSMTKEQLLNLLQ